jgi:hypothetical protein
MKFCASAIPSTNGCKNRIKQKLYSKPCLGYVYIQAPQVLPHPLQRISRTEAYISRLLFPVPLAHVGISSSHLRELEVSNSKLAALAGSQPGLSRSGLWAITPHGKYESIFFFLQNTKTAYVKSHRALRLTQIRLNNKLKHNYILFIADSLVYLSPLRWQML